MLRRAPPARARAMNSTVLRPIGSAHSEYAGTWTHETPSTHSASTGPSCEAAPRSGNIVRSPSASTSTTIVPVTPLRCTRTSTPDAARSAARRSPTPSSPTRPTKRTGQPARAAAAATLAPLPPAERVITAGVSVPRAGALARRTTTSSTRSPTTHSTATVYHAVERVQWRRGRRRTRCRSGLAGRAVAGCGRRQTTSRERRRAERLGRLLGDDRDASCCSRLPTRCCARPIHDAR